MKEKTRAIIALTAIFSLFLYYKINPVNIAEETQKSNIKDESFTVINLDDDFTLSEVKDYSNVIVEDIEPDKNEEVFNECMSNEEDINNKTFSDAFKYYRNCLGKNENFSWNGNIYSTLLASELNVENTDVNETLTHSADKEHLNLQNEIFGINQENR